MFLLCDGIGYMMTTLVGIHLYANTLCSWGEKRGLVRTTHVCVICVYVRAYSTHYHAVTHVL